MSAEVPDEEGLIFVRVCPQRADLIRLNLIIDVLVGIDGLERIPGGKERRQVLDLLNMVCIRSPGLAPVMLKDRPHGSIQHDMRGSASALILTDRLLGEDRSDPGALHGFQMPTVRRNQMRLPAPTAVNSTRAGLYAKLPHWQHPTGSATRHRSSSRGNRSGPLRCTAPGFPLDW